MPPDGKLSTSQVNDLVAWVRMGAPDPRTTRPAGNAVDLWWERQESLGLQARREAGAACSEERIAWVKNDIDRFVLAKLEADGMTGNEPADKRTLIRRAYYDVIGLPPTPEQVNAFLADNSPNAFEKVVDALARVAALRRTLGPALARRRALLRYEGAVRPAAREIRSIPMPGPIATTSSRHSTTICPTTSSFVNNSPPTGLRRAECQKESGDARRAGLPHARRSFQRQRERHHQ